MRDFAYLVSAWRIRKTRLVSYLNGKPFSRSGGFQRGRGQIYVVTNPEKLSHLPDRFYGADVVRIIPRQLEKRIVVCGTASCLACTKTQAEAFTLLVACHKLALRGLLQRLWRRRHTKLLVLGATGDRAGSCASGGGKWSQGNGLSARRKAQVDWRAFGVIRRSA
jgi:hypothetical protein